MPTASRLVTAAIAERRRIRAVLERIRDKRAELETKLEALNVEETELHEQLLLLNQIAPTDDEPELPRRLDPPKGNALRGHRIREVAVRLLASSEHPERPIHYQQWYKLFQEAGYDAVGVDPMATFLTQISRSPLIRRNSRGVYVLDFTAKNRVQARLQAVNTELRTMEQSGHVPNQEKRPSSGPRN
jgi:hypothetical protein